jgi:uncharacterized protein YlxW (UPF0749 family)
MKKKEEYLNSFVSNKNDTAIKHQWEDIMLKAGLTDVKGNGIILRLNDALIRNKENIESSLLHDSDIASIINELKKSDAQAISLNNERLISTSEQICVGTTIRINKKRFQVPFEVKAIGLPDVLYDSLSKSDIIMSLKEANIRLEIVKTNDLIVTKFNGNTAQLISEMEEFKK